MLKSEIEKVYRLQQAIPELQKKITLRTYLNNFGFSHKHIEVISGIRRCGKSTLMKQIIKHYKNNISYFNFEDSRIFDFENGDFPKLDEIIGAGKSAYFFDEIQNIKGWEVFIRQLHDRGEKIFITGSNATLMSRELGTRLTGRYIRHELYPFSYFEFLSHKNLKNNLSSFEKYIFNGGFPEYLDTDNQEILQTLLKDIVLRDIAVRYGIKNTKGLMDIALFLISNIGNEFTFHSIKKSFSIGSANSVSDYLAWLEDSYLVSVLPRFSWSAKNISVNPRKIYAVDNGLVNANSLSFSKDKGRLLENAVFLYLRQNFPDIYYFREKGECDFVVFDKNVCKIIIQVCEEIHNENKNREINGLSEAMNFFKMENGYIITKNQEDIINSDGKTIYIIPAYQFFMKEIKSFSIP